MLVLTAAPTPTAAAALTPDQLTALLREAGRGTLPEQAARLAAVFAAPHLKQPPAVEQAMGQALIALVAALRGTVEAVRRLEVALQAALEQHPQEPLLSSFPGLGVVLASRLLAEFGDDPDRFAHAQGRRAYAGTAPVTRASGKSHAVVLRRGGNRRLLDACRQWAYSAITVSPGARAHYDRRRATANGTKPRSGTWPTSLSASSTTANAGTARTARPPPGRRLLTLSRPAATRRQQGTDTRDPRPIWCRRQVRRGRKRPVAAT